MSLLCTQAHARTACAWKSHRSSHSLSLAHCRRGPHSFAALSARITCGLILVYNLADADGLLQCMWKLVRQPAELLPFGLYGGCCVEPDGGTVRSLARLCMADKDN